MGGCFRPITYRIGTIDASFAIAQDEVLRLTRAAERMWEDASGKDLFVYDEAGDLVINFVYDNRQQFAEHEATLRQELDDRKDVSDSVRDQYETLLNSYGALQESYQQQSAGYEVRLRAYNAEVAKWNEEGGAPEAVFADLEARQVALGAEQTELNTIARKLNGLVQEMNALSAKGNSVITDYNEIVDQYNERFTEEHEFTQGDYRSNIINIYQYDSFDELQIVLAHEMGHALLLDHVDGEESIMYHLMEAQSLETGITEADMAALTARCGAGWSPFWSFFTVFNI